MSKRQNLNVNLPNLIPTVTLPRHLGKVLQHIINAGSEGVTSFELSSFGCLNPIGAISHLKKRGALISTELRDFTDPLGEIHHRVAHYTYYGWRLSAERQHNETNTYKELV